MSNKKEKFNWKAGDVEIISIPKKLTPEQYDKLEEGEQGGKSGAEGTPPEEAD